MKRLWIFVMWCVVVACAPVNHENGGPAAQPADIDEVEQSAQQGWSYDSASRYAAPPAGGIVEDSVDEPADVPPRPAQEKSAAPRARREAPPPSHAQEYSFDSAADEGVSAPGEASQLGTASRAARPSKGKSASTSRRHAGGALAQESKPIQPRPTHRPGLGTGWGETRHSAVQEVHFYRDRNSPHYTGSLHYDDAQGARALAGSGSTTQASVNLGGALTVSLRDDYGHDLSAYRGNGRTVAIGRHGQRYTIAVQNHTNERFEVVLSVDGLDVVDGRPAGYNKRGYLIEPYGTLEIDGFRQSANAVAAFRFDTVNNSYAARTGSARNVGVIGAAAFGERGYSARLSAYRQRMHAWRLRGHEVQRRRQANPFPTGYAQPPLELAR